MTRTATDGVSWIPCARALPGYTERVLIPVENRVEIAIRVRSPSSRPPPNLAWTDASRPEFAWELESRRSLYHPRDVTYWSHLPAMP